MATGLPYLALDEILPRLIPHSTFQQVDRDLAYRALNLCVEHLLGAGSGVIVDATFARPPHFDLLKFLADAHATPVWLVQCKTSLNVAMERFRGRAGGHPAMDLNEERICQLHESYSYSSEGLIVDTSRSITESLSDVRRYTGLLV